MTPNTPNLGAGDLGWPRKPFFLNNGTKSFILVYNWSRFENLWILTQNDPNYPKFGVEWPRELFFRNHATKSFWYIITYMISLSLKILVCWLQITPKIPKVGTTHFSLFLAEFSGQDASNELDKLTSNLEKKIRKVGKTGFHSENGVIRFGKILFYSDLTSVLYFGPIFCRLNCGIKMVQLFCL